MNKVISANINRKNLAAIGIVIVIILAGSMLLNNYASKSKIKKNPFI
ncbi:hypothetical protein HYY71_00685 [Candidatus Woesearchaeota archaeon]|nr:hypothetical protein [Candidatus Woesearchaeota archaeon]